MKHTWIQNNNNKLIVFFNGWGCDQHSFTHLKTEVYDALMLNDYRELSMEQALIESIKTYEEINIVAWSYGVWIAQWIWENNGLNKNKAIAINGTTMPVSQQYGIPETILQGTLDHLSERNLIKFQRRMVGGSQAWERFEAIKPQRDMQEQKEELASLIQHFKQDLKNDDFYNKAIVCSKDLIFVTDNQIEFWKDKVEIKELDAPHFCFFEYKCWDDLLA